jgi:hypothetical protein
LKKASGKNDYTAFVFSIFIIKKFGQNILLKIFFKDGNCYNTISHLKSGFELKG